MSVKKRKLTEQVAVPNPTVHGKTDVGKLRSNNEDCFRILVGEEAPVGIDAIMVVADGMGGHAAGEVASEMASEGVVTLLTSRSQDETMPDGGYSQLLGQILGKINREVYRASQNPEFQGMGTTCTVALLNEHQLHVAHVGDSRAYLFKGGELIQITKDHGWVAEQVEAGHLTLEQAANHPYRNVVTRAIGTDKDVRSDTVVENLEFGDKILLSSDGLHSVVSDTDIAKILKAEDPESACYGLVKLANDHGGPDNITVVVAEIHGLDFGKPTTKKSRKGRHDIK